MLSQSESGIPGRSAAPEPSPCTKVRQRMQLCAVLWLNSINP